MDGVESIEILTILKARLTIITILLFLHAARVDICKIA